MESQKNEITEQTPPQPQPENVEQTENKTSTPLQKSEENEKPIEQQKKKYSTKMNDFFNIQPSLKQPTSNQEQETNNFISTGNLTSLSDFLSNNASVKLNKDGIIDTETKIVNKKGDFYSDPELISKNCEFIEPEHIKNLCKSFYIYNNNKYPGILVLTEFRLIFKLEKEYDELPIFPKDYFKFPLFSISKLNKIVDQKIIYGSYYLEITLKDTRIIKFLLNDNSSATFYLNLDNDTFPTNPQNLFKFAAEYNKKIQKEKNIFDGWKVYDPIKEFCRQGITEDNNLGLKYTYCNINFELCSTYPQFMVEPKEVTDEELKEASNYRSKNRLPIITYYYSGNFDNENKYIPSIWRSAQNKSGLMNSKRNSSDEKLINSIVKLSKKLIIYDCRPKLNAMANRLNGGGFEKVDNYDNVDLYFCEIDNIHKARSALNGLYNLTLSEKINDNYKFWTALDSTSWFTFVYLLLKYANEISKTLRNNNSVLIHCSDGWDRTSQLSSLSQILLDPFFRTINGFAILVEKDWLSFGHQFGLRNGIYLNQVSDDQSSPIFLQFLDAVHQLLIQFPNSFEFNEEFLLFLAKVHNLNLYGTFMYNNEKERFYSCAKKKTASVWTDIFRDFTPYLNIYFDPNSVKTLEPNFAYYNIKLWTKFFMKNNIFLINEKFFVNDFDREIFFNTDVDFYFYEKKRDDEKIKEQNAEYKKLMKLTSGFYNKVKDNLEVMESLDEGSRNLLEKIKSELLLIEKLKRPAKK